jgi:hypothetical protein
MSAVAVSRNRNPVVKAQIVGAMDKMAISPGCARSD